MGCLGSTPKEVTPNLEKISSPVTNTLNAQARAHAVKAQTSPRKPVENKKEEKTQTAASTMAQTDWKKKRAYEETDPMDWTKEMVSAWLSSVNEGSFELYSVKAEKLNLLGWQLLKFEKPEMKSKFGMKKTNHIVTFKLCLKKLRKNSKKYQADEWPPEANPVPENETTPNTAETSNDKLSGESKAESTQETVETDVQITEEKITEVKPSESTTPAQAEEPEENIEPEIPKEPEITEPVKVEEPEIVEPVKVEEPEIVEPVKVEEPEIVEPVKVEGPEIVEPVKVEEPEIVEPVKLQEPEIVEPVKVEEPEIVEPVIVEEPEIVEPVIVEELAIVEPVIVEEPKVDEPVVVEEPEMEEPVIVEQPAQTEEPEVVAPVMIEPATKATDPEIADILEQASPPSMQVDDDSTSEISGYTGSLFFSEEDFFSKDVKEDAAKARRKIDTGVSSEEINQRKQNLLDVGKVEIRAKSVETGLSIQEMKQRRQMFNDPNLDLDGPIHIPARSRASTTYVTKEAIKVDYRADDIVEENLDFSNVKEFRGLTFKEIKKTQAEAEVLEAHKVSAFEGLKFRDIQKDEKIKQDAEKLANTKLVSKSVFHQMETSPREKKHQKSIHVPRKAKKVKSVFHKMEKETHEKEKRLTVQPQKRRRSRRRSSARHKKRLPSESSESDVRVSKADGESDSIVRASEADEAV